MSRDNDLPFERGATYFGGDAAAIAAYSTGTNAIALLGKKFKTTDPVSGKDQTLMVMRNGSGGTLAATQGGIGRTFAAGLLEREFAAAVSGAGGYGYILDTEYRRLATTVADDDLCYVVVEGYCSNVRLGATNVTDGDVVEFDAAGYVVPHSTNAGYVVGRVVETQASTGQGNEDVDVMIGSNAANYDNT